MAEVIFSNIFFLAFSPIPGGASIRQTGTFHSFLRSSAPTFSSITEQRAGVGHCSWAKTVCGMIASVSDRAGQFSGPSGQFRSVGTEEDLGATVARLAVSRSASINGRGAGDERKER